MRRPCRAFGGALFAAALVLTGALGARVPWLRGAAFSDYIVAHAPQIAFVRRAWEAWHTVPLWSPVYNAGYPLYANPLASPAYPPGWLAYLLPVPWGLNLTLLLHLAWGVLGWGCWARGKGLRAWPWFGLVAGLLPRTLAYFLGGHVTLVYALAWFPWMLWGVDARPRWMPAGALALIVLADPRAAVLAAPLLAVAAWQKAGRRAWQDLARWAVLAGLGAAPLWLPLLVFTMHSARGRMTFADRTLFSTPWYLALDLWAPLPYPPNLGVEFRAYVPWSIALLALSGWRDRTVRGWLALAGLGVMLALGRYGPLALLWRLPGLTWLRVPARFWWLTAFAGLIAAGLVAARGEAPPTTHGYRRGWWFWGVGGLLLRGLGWPLLFSAHIVPWAYAFASAADALAWWRLRPGRGRVTGWAPWALALLAGLATLGPYASARDLASIEATDVRVAQRVLRAAGTAPHPWGRRWIGPRVYSPSYSIGQWTAARLGVPLAYGVDPLYTAAWASWLQRASRVPMVGYSVVLPPLANGDPDTANKAHRPSAERLAEARVRYAVAAFPQDARGWVLRWSWAGLWVYENAHRCPPAWVEDPARPGCSAARPASVVHWSPHRVVLVVQGPGRVVLSEGAYPTWQVRVDGLRVAAVPRGPWRAVDVPAGAHRVEWRLWPWDLALGWALAGLGLAMVGVDQCWLSLRRDHGRSAALTQGG